MSRKVVIISASLRKNSNSEALALAFKEGAEAAGHEVEFISLKDKKLSFCKGCFSCQKTLLCTIKDDASAIVESLRQAQVIVFATPVYYYEMAGQLKTLLDRANPLYPSDYAFGDVYLLATATDTDATAIDGARQGVLGWVRCFPKAQFKQALFCGGVTDPGDIAANSAALDGARELGAQL
ncbi:MAG: flavodoxin family protein [Succinivibrio sp.]|nr:flavodoxin family protein [Succinivibrio sp.]